LGRTLLPASHHDLLVRAVNTTPESRLVRKGTCLGLLTAVCEPCVEISDDVPSKQSTPLASQTIINNLPSDLDNIQREQTIELIRSYISYIFSQNDYDIGRTHLVEHAINTRDHRPIRQSLRRHPLPHLEVIDH